MNDLHEYARLSLTVSVGSGLLAAGVGNALFGPRRWWGQVTIALLGVVLSWGLAHLFESPVANILPVVGLAAIGLVGGCRTTWFNRFMNQLVRPFRGVRMRWVGVALLGALGIGYEVVRYDLVSDARLEQEMTELSDRMDRAEGIPVGGVAIRTDRGQSITGVISAQPRTREQMKRAEMQLLTELPCGRQVIKRGEPSDDSNCHGWVFTGGQYGIPGRQVETILADNGYRLVTQPAEGDVCVYRDVSGLVSHTAVVRSVLPDGTILVEGKWGWMGVYLHPVQASCYGTNFEYHRTARANHLLVISRESGVSVSVP